MPLRCLDGSGRSLQAFDFSDEGWQALAQENRVARHLRMPCCAAPVILKRSPLGCPYRKLDPGQGTVETAEVRDELEQTIPLDRPRERRVFAERQVRSRVVVVVGISSKHAAQMRFAEDDHMVQAFSSD